MLWTQLVAFVAVFMASVPATPLCSIPICQCYIRTIKCVCTKVQDTLIIDGDSSVPNNVDVVEIDGCRRVQLGPDGRVRLGQLTIRRTDLLIVDAMQLAVANLTVQDVVRVEVRPRARFYPTVEYQSFVFQDSHLDRLPMGMLTSSLQLVYLEFTNASIGTIESEAIVDPVTSASNVTRLVVRNCTVGPVAPKGVALHVGVVHIIGNRFQGHLAPCSWVVERADEFVFMENVVSGRLVNDTFRVSAAGVAILGNRFRFVDRRSFLDVRSVINDDQPGEWLWIFGNDVEAVNGVPFVTAATLTDCDGCHIGDNKLPCDCKSLAAMASDVSATNVALLDAGRCRHDATTTPGALLRSSDADRALRCGAAGGAPSVPAPLTGLVIVAVFSLFPFRF